VFAKILVANDGSDGAFKAFGVALDLAVLSVLLRELRALA